MSQHVVNRTWVGALAVGLVAALTGLAQDDEPAQPQLPIEPRAVEILFTDGSNLRLHLADEPIEMTTPHGKLKIPAADVLRIEFAQRLSPEVERQIEDLLTQLKSDDEGLRGAATEGLVLLGAKAYPALAQAAKSSDAQFAAHAAEALRQFHEQVPASELAVRTDDLIETPDTKIAGQITNQKLKLETAQFGPLAMNLADARSLRHQSLIPAQEEPATEETLPDPGNLKAYERRIGETFSFQVTAATGGSVWGTDIYTTDSRLSTAAIHAGVLKEGESGVVRVKISAGQPSYAGSARNGVTSSGYGAYGGSYEILKPMGAAGAGPRVRFMRGPAILPH